MNCQLDGIMNINIALFQEKRHFCPYILFIHKNKQKCFLCKKKIDFFPGLHHTRRWMVSPDVNLCKSGNTDCYWLVFKYWLLWQLFKYWLLLVGFQILTAMASFQILTAIGWFSNTDNCYGWFSIKIIKSSKWSAPGFHIFFCKSTLQESWR